MQRLTNNMLMTMIMIIVINITDCSRLPFQHPTPNYDGGCFYVSDSDTVFRYYSQGGRGTSATRGSLWSDDPDARLVDPARWLHPVSPASTFLYLILPPIPTGFVTWPCRLRPQSQTRTSTPPLSAGSTLPST